MEDLTGREFVGMYYLHFQDETVLHYGQIINKVNEDYYLIDSFDWIFGQHTHSRLKSFEELKECAFFVDKDHIDNFIERNKIKLFKKELFD